MSIVSGGTSSLEEMPTHNVTNANAANFGILKDKAKFKYYSAIKTGFSHINTESKDYNAKSTADQ